LPPATLQHFALRTPNLPAMLAFYTEQLGFVLSDAVKDPEGTLRACFLRTDALHHALALFLAPAACFDHQSFETPDWASMKVWGDHMAALKVPIVWGIGRHGPGNDVFFMVRDPDGNLAEISRRSSTARPAAPPAPGRTRSARSTSGARPSCAASPRTATERHHHGKHQPHVAHPRAVQPRAGPSSRPSG
jgi:catechol 2,3-dioxygenase-like lactoylglutathione lyase family enzyme